MLEAFVFVRRQYISQYALHKKVFSVIVYLSALRGDGGPQRATGFNNFRVTRLTHRSVFWLRRKRN